MKIKVTIISLFVLGFGGMSSIMQVSASTLAMQQFDKTTMIKKKFVDAQKYISNEDYLAAQNTLNSLLKIDPNNSRAKELLDECELGIKKQKQRVHQAYQDACKDGTILALQNFISKYPNSEYISNAKSRIEDYSLWQKTKEQNSIESYNSYLDNSMIKAYKIEAQTAIKRIQEEQSWSTCKDSENEDLLEDFLRNYPESSNLEEAKYKLNLLRGERMYKDGIIDMAYNYLGDANSHRMLTGEAAVHYAELKDKKTFNEMLASSDIDKVRKYLNTLSFSSSYYNETSNHLALLLGAELSAWSSDYSMSEALNYAKDEATKDAVKKYISQAKELRKIEEKQRKTRARKAWWKDRVSFGWNVVDFGTTINGDNDLKLMHIGSGLRVRFGKYSDCINIILGADYQYYLLKEDYSSKPNGGVHQGVAMLNIRFNLAELFQRSRIYIGCAGKISFVSFGKDISDDIIKRSSISIEPQIGLQGKKWDFGIYYCTFTDKNGIFEYYVTNNNNVGGFFTWYF